MAIVSMEHERELERCKVVMYLPDTSFVSFVAKLQKAKTRKNKEYFVLRATLPKEVAEKVDAKAGDYLFFRTKKAQWYHMLDWRTMETTWNMLPTEIRNRAIMDGLSNVGATQIASTLGATNLSAPTQQALEQGTVQNGGFEWK